MTGRDLQQILFDKWGYSYDIQFRRFKGRFYVLIMWKYLEQASFGLSEPEYLEHLNGVLSYLSAWGVTQQVVEAIAKTKEKPRVGKAISIPVELGDRASEWLLEES
jgi:hypothetical protein